MFVHLGDQFRCNVNDWRAPDRAAAVQSYWIDAVNGVVILIALVVSRLLGGESAQ